MKIFITILLCILGFSSSAQQLKKKGSTYEIKYKNNYKYPRGPELGSTIPFSNDIIDIYGDTITSKILKTGITVFNFWFIGCTGCKLEEPNLLKLSTHFSNNPNINFVSLCASPIHLINKYYEKNEEFGYRTISVTRSFVEETFKVVVYPTQLYYVNGILQDKTAGAMDEEYELNWMIEYIEKHDKKNSIQH